MPPGDGERSSAESESEFSQRREADVEQPRRGVGDEALQIRAEEHAADENVDGRKRLALAVLAGALGSTALGLVVVFATLVTRGSPAAAPPASAAPRGTVTPPVVAKVPSARVRVVVTADTDISEIRGPGVAGVKFSDKGAELDLPRSDQSVTLRIGTSSMDLGTTSGSPAPGGSRPRLLITLL